jgi:hypothetical protein
MKELIESRQKLFREKCTQSYAKGGFLTTDLVGDWALDASPIESFHSETANLMVEEFKRIINEMIQKEDKDSFGYDVQTQLNISVRINAFRDLLQSLTE